jgi:hypothetical protein
MPLRKDSSGGIGDSDIAAIPVEPKVATCYSCGHCHAVAVAVAVPVVKKKKNKDARVYSWTAGLSADEVTPCAIIDRLRVIYASIASPTASQASMEDLALAQVHKASLLYGEVQTAGVTRLMDLDHLHAGGAQRVCDIGMGCGRAVFQMALQFPQLVSVVGIELASDRYQACLQAAERFSQPEQEERKNVSDHVPVSTLHKKSAQHTSLEIAGSRMHIDLHHGSLFEYSKQLADADVILCNVDFPLDQRPAWLEFLTTHVRPGARIATYLCLEDIGVSLKEQTLNTPQDSEAPIVSSLLQVPGWKRLAINSSDAKSDRFLTSWSPILGHKFYLYTRC